MIERLPSKDLTLLVQGIVSYKKGIRDYLVQESQAAEIFVKTSETAIGRTVAFSSPLALYNTLHRNLTFHDCFE